MNKMLLIPKERSHVYLIRMLSLYLLVYLFISFKWALILSGDELVLTEMLFNGIFNDMTVTQCVAILSCFVINENVKEDVPKLTQELSGPFKIIQVRFDFLCVFFLLSYCFITRILLNVLQLCQKNVN
jgi:hypothetical protein